MDDLPAPKKQLGQHWLTDPASLQAMIQCAKVSPKDTILEIGPGFGSLTELLVKQAKEVIAVEFDPTLAHDLSKRVSAENLVVIRQDILRFDYSELPTDYKIVANIPYYLTSNLIRSLSETINPPKSATLLLQKEVAQRICAFPGQMSLLSVTAQFYWQPTLGEVIKAHLFSPPPKVDSQILMLERREQILFPDVPPKSFFWLVKAGFSQRRKTLSNALRSGLRLDKQVIEKLLKQAGIDPTRRPQNLSLEQWRDLYLVLEKNNRIML